MATYEQDEVPTYRRGLWLALWFIVIAVALWTVVWLIFFREPAPKTSTLHGSNTKQDQSSGNKNQNSGSNSGNNNGNGSGDTGSADQLANAGAGNVIVPFAVASAAGTAIYYVRLRKKVSQ